MTNILFLAPELIHTIGDLLEIRDAKNLRMACRNLSQFLEHRVLRTVSIKISDANAEQKRDMLRAMATYGSRYATSRSTQYVIFTMYSWSALWNRAATQHMEGASPSVVSSLEEDISKNIFHALVSLTNLLEVKWILSMENKSTQAAVVNALRALPHLQTLSIANASRLMIEILFQEMVLKEVHIHGYELPAARDIGDPRSLTWRNLAEMIAQSRPGQLEHLHIEMKHVFHLYSAHTERAASLHYLLCSYSRDLPPLRLRKISLSRCFLKLDELTLPHLRHLTSLDIVDIEYPLDPGTYDADEGIVDLHGYPMGADEILQSQRSVGSESNEIWIQMIRSKIYLETIALRDPPVAFMDYLQQYSGLRSLSLVINPLNIEQSGSDALALRFFEDALVGHLGGLEELAISAHKDGLWCFGKHNEVVLSQCKKLCNFKVTLSPIRLGKVPQEELQEITLLLDVAIALPNIINLEISLADHINNDDLYVFIAGARRLRHRPKKNIVHTLNLYSAPPTVRRLPSLEFTGRWFIGPTRFCPVLRNDVDSINSAGWRYIVDGSEDIL